MRGPVRWSLEGCGKARSGSDHTNLRSHAHFAQKLFADALHVEVNCARGLCDEFDGAEFQRF